MRLLTFATVFSYLCELEVVGETRGEGSERID